MWEGDESQGEACDCAVCATGSRSLGSCRHLFTLPIWQLRQQAEAAAAAAGLPGPHGTPLRQVRSIGPFCEEVARDLRRSLSPHLGSPMQMHGEAASLRLVSPSKHRYDVAQSPAHTYSIDAPEPSRKRDGDGEVPTTEPALRSRPLSPRRPQEKALPRQNSEPAVGLSKASLTPQHTAARACRRQQRNPLQQAMLQQLDKARRSRSCNRMLTPGGEGQLLSQTQGDATHSTSFVGVFVRLRPPNVREQGEAQCVHTDGANICIKEPGGTSEHRFTFEQVIDSSCSAGQNRTPDQIKVFEAVGSRVIQSVTEGFHTCVFALGQTGTGKTYTLIGKGEEPGLLPLTLRQLLKPDIPGEASDDSCCRLSCVELHMDRLQDLLAEDSSEHQGLDIRCHPQSGVTVPNLTEVAVASVQSAIRLVNMACRRRNVTQTSMNALSSRGHAIFQVTNRIGTKLCIVDLAGRENERTTRCRGQSLAELGHINKSLFHLTTVIQALARPNTGGIVPFRNSKLTLLLSEPLQSARTFLLATASPVASSFDETLATLRLAKSVTQIATRTRCERQPEVPQLEVPRLSVVVPQSSESSSLHKLDSALPIPFAPRLQHVEPVPSLSTGVEPAHEAGESRPSRFRLEAWKMAPSSDTSRASTDTGDPDSSFYELVDSTILEDEEADASSLVDEVMETMFVGEVQWAVS